MGPLHLVSTDKKTGRSSGRWTPRNHSRRRSALASRTPRTQGAQTQIQTLSAPHPTTEIDEGDPAPLYKLIEKYGINYPVLFADDALAKGFGGVTGIPVAFLVNHKGEIVKKYLGYVEHDVLEEEIKSMLAES